MQYVSFSDDKKIAMFDEIAARFYDANFGQAAKSDIELMMFNFYIQKLIDTNKNNDGTIDYRKCSDYKISKDLGITQQRVRNLKVKNQLVNPIDFKWEKAFAKLVENARYDKVSKKVTIGIPDPNLYLEIQNLIEEQGAYIEKQLNSKILQIRVEYFIDLIIKTTESENDRDDIIKKVQKELKKNNKDDSKFDRDNIGKSIIELGASVTGILSSILSIFKTATPQYTIIIALLKLIK